MTRTHSLLLASAALLAAVSLLANCRGGPSPTGTALGQEGSDEALWEGADAALKDAAVMKTAFGIVRAAVDGGAAPAAGRLAELPGRRAFVCVYGVEHPNLCATGVGKDLAGSIAAAAKSLDSSYGDDIDEARSEDDADVRFKIDVVTRIQDRTFDRDIERPKKRRVATYGYWVELDEKSSWVLPSEVLEQGVFDDNKKRRGIPRKNLEAALQRKVKGFPDLPEEFSYTRFWTEAWVEGDPNDGEPDEVLRLYRTHRAEFDALSEELLLQRTVWAADYLISSISPEGKIRYLYYPVKDRDSRSYNLLRHGGTTYSILQAYDRTKYEPYRLAAERAISYLFARTREDVREGPFGGGPTKWILSPGNKVKLGGAGLALVMLDQYGEATGDFDTYREDAIKFGNFLVAELKEDGEFVYFPSLEPGGPPTDTDDSAYYPGEAILGLIRLYSWDRNEKWLNAAKAASDWLIDVRDKGKNEKRLANDHWLMIALSYLYAETKEEKYLTHSLNLARAVEYQYLKNKSAWDEFPDYRGGYYDPPRSTPAATRGEGLVAVLDTCRVAEIDCGWVRDLLMETIRHENLSQYDPDTIYWIKNKKKAFGGWNGGLLDVDIRNDFVQHNMSAVLGAERHMAWFDRQQMLPGGPQWTKKNLAEGLRWEGPSDEQSQTLHADTWRYRGDNYWETQWKDQQAGEAPAPGATEPGAAPDPDEDVEDEE